MSSFKSKTDYQNAGSQNKRIIYIRKKPDKKVNNSTSVRQNFQRSRKLEQIKNRRSGNIKGGQLIKFSVPFHLRCSKCEKMIAKGINIKCTKKKLYKEKNVLICSYKFFCIHCKNPIEFMTDPDKREDLLIDYGCKKYFNDFDDDKKKEEKTYDRAKNDSNITGGPTDNINQAKSGGNSKKTLTAKMEELKKEEGNNQRQVWSLCNLYNKKQRLRDDLELNELVMSKFNKEKELNYQSNINNHPLEMKNSKQFEGIFNDKSRLNNTINQLREETNKVKNDLIDYEKKVNTMGNINDSYGMFMIENNEQTNLANESKAPFKKLSSTSPIPIEDVKNPSPNNSKGINNQSLSYSDFNEASVFYKKRKRLLGLKNQFLDSEDNKRAQKTKGRINQDKEKKNSPPHIQIKQNYFHSSQPEDSKSSNHKNRITKLLNLKRKTPQEKDSCSIPNEILPSQTQQLNNQKTHLSNSLTEKAEKNGENSKEKYISYLNNYLSSSSDEE